MDSFKFVGLVAVVSGLCLVACATSPEQQAGIDTACALHRDAAARKAAADLAGLHDQKAEDVKAGLDILCALSVPAAGVK